MDDDFKLKSVKWMLFCKFGKTYTGFRIRQKLCRFFVKLMSAIDDVIEVGYILIYFERGLKKKYLFN